MRPKIKSWSVCVISSKGEKEMEKCNIRLSTISIEAMNCFHVIARSLNVLYKRGLVIVFFKIINSYGCCIILH